MDCEQALLLISAALDGEVTEAELAALAEHLNECPECRAISEDFGVYSVALSGMGVAAPDGLIETINAALDAEETPAATAAPVKSRHRRAWGSLAAMFAVVVCLGGVFTLFNSRFSSGSTEALPRASSAVMDAAEAEPAEAPQMETAEEFALESARAEDEDIFSSFNSTAADSGTYASTESVAESGEIIMNDMTPAEPAPVIVPAIETDLTPMDGLMQVYELLGGADAWPQAEFDSEAQDCVLAVEENDGVTLTTSIRYTGLSENGWYYTYQLNTEEDDGFVVHFSFVNYYALKLDDSELLTAFEGEWNSEDYDAFQAQIDR